MSYSYNRTARIDPFTEKEVETMRKDILTLVKNVDRIEVDHYDLKLEGVKKQYDELNAAMRAWAATYKERLYEDFIPHITVPIRVWLTGTDKFPDNPEDDRREAELVKEWDKKLRLGTWDLYINLSLPRFEHWEHEKKPWAEKVRRAARKAWKTLTDFLDWLKTRNVTPFMKTRSVEQVRLEGFNVTIIGWDPETEEYCQKALDIFKEGLRHYHQRASAVAPILLRQQVPLVFRYDCGLDKGGEYQGNHIVVCATAAKEPDEQAKTLAHEMGHHLYKQLSEAQVTYWIHAVHQDLGDLDLRDLLKVWHPGESIWDLTDRLIDVDPVLKLQLEGIFYKFSQYQWTGNWDTREELEEYLNNGGKSTWTVPKHPITAYSSKNPEEAFCETIGNAVAFGPRTLDPLVRHWFKTIMGNTVKMASSGYTYARTV